MTNISLEMRQEENNVTDSIKKNSLNFIKENYLN